MKTTTHCLECNKTLSWSEQQYSNSDFGFPLCYKHQVLIQETGATDYAIHLYLALKSRNIPVVLEYHDGHKRIDIAIPGKLYIEVNGGYHSTRRQALTDLTRSVYSLQEHIPTIPVPNYLLNNPHSFHQTVEKLTKACQAA